MTKVQDLKIKIFADGADLKQISELNKKEYIKDCPGWLFQFPTENPVKAEML